MIERYYTYTVSHCSKAIKYGLYWLINELDKNHAVKGCFLALGKGNFCNKHNTYWKEDAIGKSIMTKICKNGYVMINKKKIELQYPRNLSISSFTSIVAFYPNKKLINKIEEEIAFSQGYEKQFLPPNPNALPKSLLVIPWIEFNVDEWIEKFNPNKIDIECPEYYKYGYYRKHR